MNEAYIYDAVRTPRGKGKKTGSLHEITALELSTQTLEAIRDRNNLDTKYVDDVVLGCVSPVGEQGVDMLVAAATTAKSIVVVRVETIFDSLELELSSSFIVPRCVIVLSSEAAEELPHDST